MGIKILLAKQRKGICNEIGSGGKWAKLKSIDLDWKTGLADDWNSYSSVQVTFSVQFLYYNFNFSICGWGWSGAIWCARTIKELQWIPMLLQVCIFSQSYRIIDPCSRDPLYQSPVRNGYQWKHINKYMKRVKIMLLIVCSNENVGNGSQVFASGMKLPNKTTNNKA